jgi:hypothetical protein
VWVEVECSEIMVAVANIVVVQAEDEAAIKDV